MNNQSNPEYMNDINVRLSLQRALLCEISPNLRLVAFDYDKLKKEIFLYFYFDKQITDENKSSVNSIAGEVTGDFDEKTQVVEKCIHLDFPARLPAHQFSVYHRKE
ncbi:MAG: hypothetical protein ACHQT8_06010 [Chlamydiales bacterium]